MDDPDMDDRAHLPPNTDSHYLYRRLAAARSKGHQLRFDVRPKDRAGYELSVRYVDNRGLPQRDWLMVDKNREKLERVRLALEAQEPGAGDTPGH